MRIARSRANSNTDQDQQYKWFYLLEIPGSPNHWKFGETYNVKRRLGSYNSLLVEPMERFEYEWIVPDWLQDRDLHPALLQVAERAGTPRRVGVAKEMFVGDVADIEHVITRAVEQAWDEDDWKYGRRDDRFNGQTLTLADLSALDDSEWESIEIDHPMSNELVDHLLNRLKPDMAEVA